MKPNKLFLCLFVFSNLLSNGQEPELINYTTDHGLPSSETYAVLQDSSGYIWIASDNGVSRFDGYNFKNYTIENGLINNVVLKLYLDYKGRVWFIHSNRTLSYYDNGQIFPYGYNYLLKKSPRVNGSNVEILSIKIDKNENLLIKWAAHGFSTISASGEYFYKDKKIDKQYYLDYNKMFNDFCIITPMNFHDILQDHEFEHILNLSFSSEKIELPSHLDSLCPGRYRYLLEDGMFIFSIKNSLFVLKNNNVQHAKFQNTITSIYKNGNELWLGFIDNGGMKIIELDNINNTKRELLKGRSIPHIIKDKEGGIWCSTLKNGIYYIKNYTFQTLIAENTESFNNAILAEDKVIVANSEGYLFQIDTQNKISRLTKTNFDRIFNIQYCNNNLFVLARDAYRIKDNKAQRMIYLDSIGHSEIKIINQHLLPITENKYLMLTKSGIFYLEQNNEYFTLLGGKNRFKNSTNSFVVRDSMYYITNYRGLFRFIPNKKNIAKSKLLDLSIKNPELKTRIDEGFYNPFDNRIWMGTKNKGLMAWMPETNSILTINKSNGLIDNWVTSIAFQDSILLVGTKVGLQKIIIDKSNPSRYKIQTFTITHGLPTNEINDIIIRDENAYVTTHNGICYFDLRNITINNHPPEIFISDMEVNGISAPVKNEYSLEYTQNNIQISVVGLAYKAHPNITYKYRLLGADSSWSKTNNRDLRFPQLAPDNYEFEIIAQNEDGYWSKKPARVIFSIKPPYWETWWFRIIIGLIITVTVWGAFQYRMREIKKRNALEKRKTVLERNLSKTQQRLIIQQLNPHFLFNTMSSIQYMVLNNQKLEAVGLLSKFARMMRQGLEYSRVEYASLQQSIEFFRNYIDLKSINLKEKIKVVIDTPNINPDEGCTIPPMLIQPFIENAIIHGLTPKGKDMKLSLIFKEDGRNIKCTIKDNGIGRKESARLKKEQTESHKSFGLKIIKETLEMMNTLHDENYQVIYTDLFDEDKKNCGTQVEISFPKFKISK